MFHVGLAIEPPVPRRNGSITGSRTKYAKARPAMKNSRTSGSADDRHRPEHRNLLRRFQRRPDEHQDLEEHDRQGDDEGRAENDLHVDPNHVGGLEEDPVRVALRAPAKTS